MEVAAQGRLHLPRTRRFAFIYLSAVGCSFLVTSLLLIAQFGWTAFWHRLGTRHIDSGSYDLLVTTVLGVMGIFLALWYSSVVAIAAFEQSANLQHVAYRLSTWWTFGPALYFCSTMNFLLAAAWGIGRSWIGLLFMPSAGAVALYCIIRMTQVALSPVQDGAEGRMVTRNPSDPAPSDHPV